ncbi:MAG: sensor histidine kinase, partial [Actinomycetota bacterium]|nr:sensor histidine kinase [Actinomycetota bacterium]
GTFDPMSPFRNLARTYWFELLIAVLAVAGILELVVGRDSPAAPALPFWIAVPALVVLVLPLFARRRFPFGAPAVYWLVAAALSFVDGLLIPFIGSLEVVGFATGFLLGYQRDDRRAGAGLAIVLAGIGLVMANIPGPPPVSVLVFVPLRFVVAWVAGYALRERSQQAEAAEMRATLAEHEREAAEMRATLAEREREAAARVAVAEERARIARELHDIVAHAMSVMVLQVGAVRHMLPESLAEGRDALGRVELAGRTALAEMRRLLGAMRREGDDLELGPQPGLDALGSLVEDVVRAGLPVRVHVEGEPLTLPRAIDLSAYRIVQEGLTNALKHSRASHADVTVRYRPDEVELKVADDGKGPDATNGGGHGLIGIRERVNIYGGEMSAGPRPGGGFILTARLAVDRYQR